MDIPLEFATVVNCKRCDQSTCGAILRDDASNPPQPGFIGAHYFESRVLLVGQNPGESRFPQEDAQYAEALWRVGREPSEESMTSLAGLLSRFIPQWPVHGNYFPLHECGLQLEDIAYFNAVRCRTSCNAKPSPRMVSTCSAHFERWLDTLRPRVAVFIGKWAFDLCGALVQQRSIPTAFMNRHRSLPGAERHANRMEVVALVKGALAGPRSSMRHLPAT